MSGLLSNAQFRPRRAGSANAGVPSGSSTMKVPTKTIRISRNARSATANRKF